MSASVRKPVKKSVKNSKERVSDVRDRTPGVDKVMDVADHVKSPRRKAITAFGGLAKMLGMRNTVLLAAGGAAGYLAGRVTRGGRRSKKR